MTHDYFTRWTVFFLTEGEFRYCIEGGGEHTLHQDEILICPPYYNVDKVATQEISLFIAFWEGGKDSVNTPLGELVLQMNDRIRENLRLLQDLPERSPFALHLQTDLWYQLCMLYRDPIISARQTRKPNAFVTLLDYIEVSLPQKLTLDDLASYSGYSKSSLIRYFQENTHCTPMQYVAERRLDLAKRKLADSQLTVRAVAELCGFQNEFYFSTVFRKQTGLSPSAFRKQNGST